MNPSAFHLRLDGDLLRSLFDRVYVINLPDRTDRLNEMAGQFSRIGLGMDDSLVQVFPAVRPDHQGDFGSIGARGCFMSHLGVLKDAVAQGYNSILVLEDDVDWTAAAIGHGLDALSHERWEFLHGGIGHGKGGAVQLRSLAPDENLMLTHFIALRGEAIGLIVSYLEAMLGRPGGSPEGGPMDVDGAYSWFRKDHPGVAAYVCEPAIAHQRSSRSDITEPTGWRATKAADWARKMLRPFRAYLRG